MNFQLYPGYLTVVDLAQTTVLQQNKQHKIDDSTEKNDMQQMVGWVRFNVNPEHIIGHIGDGCLRIKWPNQQCQSTEGRCSRIRLQSYQVHPTMLQ